MKNQRFLIRFGAVVVYLLAVVLLYTNAKGHLILVDNKKDPSGAWGEYRFFDAGLNGQKPVEFAKGDRIEFPVAGQNHRIRVELEDGAVVEKDFSVPLDQPIMVLSVPKMVAGLEPWLEVFVPPVRARPQEPAEEDAVIIPVDNALTGGAPE